MVWCYLKVEKKNEENSRYLLLFINQIYFGTGVYYMPSTMLNTT